MIHSQTLTLFHWQGDFALVAAIRRLSVCRRPRKKGPVDGVIKLETIFFGVT